MQSLYLCSQTLEKLGHFHYILLLLLFIAMGYECKSSSRFGSGNVILLVDTGGIRCQVMWRQTATSPSAPRWRAKIAALSTRMLSTAQCAALSAQQGAEIFPDL